MNKKALTNFCKIISAKTYKGGDSMDEDKKPEEKTPEQIFQEGFEKLVNETGCTINTEPVFFPQDNGSFSITFRTSVVRRK